MRLGRGPWLAGLTGDCRVGRHGMRQPDPSASGPRIRLATPPWNGRTEANSGSAGSIWMQLSRPCQERTSNRSPPPNDGPLAPNPSHRSAWTVKAGWWDPWWRTRGSTLPRMVLLRDPVWAWWSTMNFSHGPRPQGRSLPTNSASCKAATPTVRTSPGPRPPTPPWLPPPGRSSPSVPTHQSPCCWRSPATMQATRRSGPAWAASPPSSTQTACIGTPPWGRKSTECSTPK